MKFIILFALAFATVSAKDFYSRWIEVAALENEGRITNGRVAAQGQFKYQVGLEFNKQETVRFCGGALISKEWVFLAAHCTLDALSVTVYLGSTHRSVGDICYDVEMQHVVNHPLWDSNILRNDIALIKIPETNESNTIGIVKIPNDNNDKYLRNSVVITGWGRTSDNSTLSDDLRYGILKVSPPDTCLRYGAYFNDDLNICVATPTRVSTCRGDSGSPLVLEGSNIQIGVFSFFDINSCTQKRPIVFTRVSAFRLWIMSRVEPIHNQSNYVVLSNRSVFQSSKP